MREEELPVWGNVLMSVQRALLGRVTPNLRGVTVGWESKLIRVHCFYDGVVSDDDHRRMDEVADQVRADFPDDFDCELVVERYDPGFSLNERTLDLWVYLRYEKR